MTTNIICGNNSCMIITNMLWLVAAEDDVSGKPWRITYVAYNYGLVDVGPPSTMKFRKPCWFLT